MQTVQRTKTSYISRNASVGWWYDSWAGGHLTRSEVHNLRRRYKRKRTGKNDWSHYRLFIIYCEPGGKTTLNGDLTSLCTSIAINGRNPVSKWKHIFICIRYSWRICHVPVRNQGWLSPYLTYMSTRLTYLSSITVAVSSVLLHCRSGGFLLQCVPQRYYVASCGTFTNGSFIAFSKL